MAKYSSEDNGITDINIVPFVDIILVLLVILMLTAPTLYQSSVRVELPNVYKPTGSEKITLRIQINKDNQMFLDQKQIETAQLPALYEKARSIDPEVDAIIEADKGLSHGQVMGVIDMLRSAGMNHIAIGAVAK